jgi:hypothetical protein
MANIFISHSWSDKAFALKLKAHLEGHAHTVWLDNFEMIAGDSIRDKIDKGIDNASVVIFVLSPESVRSKWFDYELDVARRLAGIERKKYIVPLLLEDCAPLPPDFVGVLHVNCRNGREEGLSELLQGIERWERTQTAGATQPTRPAIPPLPAEPPAKSAPTQRSKRASVTFMGLALGVLAYTAYEAQQGAASNPPPHFTPQPRAEAEAPSVAGQGQKSLVKLRRQHRVRPLQSHELYPSVAQLPAGVFGFIQMESRTSLSQAPVHPSSSPNAFEVHKSASGALYLVGYAHQSDPWLSPAARMNMTLSATLSSQEQYVVSIPFERISSLQSTGGWGATTVQLSLAAP